MTQVVAAALFDDHGRVLLAQRGAFDRHHAHQWEFPGGKVEAGEGLGQALTRELHEELLLNPSSAPSWKPLPGGVASDPGRDLQLHLLASRRYGPARCVEHQELRWIPPVLAASLDLARLDRRLLRRLAAPHLLTISGDVIEADYSPRFRPASAPDWWSGPWPLQRWFMLRSPQLTEKAYAEQLMRVADSGHRSTVGVLAHNRIDLVAMAGVHGVHLSSWKARELPSRPVGPDRWLSVACHSAAEIEHALKLDADWLLLSPVRRTASHPDRPALGWSAFRHMTQRLELPVIALGGMHPNDWRYAHRKGAHGVAGIRAF
ncbi:MAG: thiamine phosphate synthase [Xanthomonadales bacterium]|nr:thiamine phosphate synthase [Xanthomonadales bacterium]